MKLSLIANNIIAYLENSKLFTDLLYKGLLIEQREIPARVEGKKDNRKNNNQILSIYLKSTPRLDAMSDDARIQ